MPICKKCGKEFPSSFLRIFFQTDICAACKNVKKERVQLYVDKLEEYGMDKYLDVPEEKKLAELRTDLGLDDDDLKHANRMLRNLRKMTKLADVEQYVKKLKEIAEDNYLSPEEETELLNLRRTLSLSEEDISHTIEALIHLKRLTALKTGKLPILETDLLLKKREVCHYEIPAELIEEKTKTEYIGGTSGVSVRISKRVYYRVGGFKGKRVIKTSKEVTDRGSLYITNKRILFTGEKKTVTYPVNKVVKINKFADAIQFQKESEAKLKYFVVGDQNSIDEIGIIVRRIISGDLV